MIYKQKQYSAFNNPQNMVYHKHKQMKWTYTPVETTFREFTGKTSEIKDESIAKIISN